MTVRTHSAAPAYRPVLIPPWQLLTLLFLLVFTALPLNAATVTLDQHWEYRWGDSPFSGNTPEWTLQDEPDAWQPIDFPSNPPGRNGQENIWYRTLVPQGHWHDPVLYIFSVDLIVEAYLDGQRIYQYGHFDSNGRGQFEGWPWHMIQLPPDAAGKPIYFRIFSNYTDIGLWGEVKVTERMTLYQQVFEDSIDSLTITAFSLVIALLCLLFALFNTERNSLLALALFSLSHAGLALTGSQAKQLLMHHPLLWDYIEAGCYYVLPIALALLLRSWYGARYRRLFNSFALLFGAYLVGALILPLTGLTSLAHTYPPFDLMFAIGVPTMLIIVARHWRSASHDQRLLLLATALLTVLLLLDMAVAHGLLPWSQVPVDWGSLIFSLAIVALSLSHFSHTRKALAELNATLESRVAERTHALEQMARQDAKHLKALEFGNSKRGILDELVVEMESLADINQATDYLSTQIHTLCSPVPGAFYSLAPGSSQLQQRNHWDTTASLATNLQPDALQLPHDDWHVFNIHYDAPGLARTQVATLLLDFGTDSILFDELSPFTLQTLFTRAIERINLTLSKVALQQALSRFSYEDALTGLHNRRYLDEMLDREIARGQRSGASIALVMCDIDHFKKLNDRYGHAAGDRVLQVVAQQIRAAFRSSDIICRYGGEEFVIVMPESQLDDARARAEQLRIDIAASHITFDDINISNITLSAGVSARYADDTTADILLRTADKALYQAKNSGRNRVITADSPTQAQPTIKQA